MFMIVQIDIVPLLLRFEFLTCSFGNQPLLNIVSSLCISNKILLLALSIWASIENLVAEPPSETGAQDRSHNIDDG